MEGGDRGVLVPYKSPLEMMVQMVRLLQTEVCLVQYKSSCFLLLHFCVGENGEMSCLCCTLEMSAETHSRVNF